MVFFGEPSMADKIGFLITMVIVLSIFIYFEIKNWLENRKDKVKIDLANACVETEELLTKQIEATYKVVEENKELKEKLNKATEILKVVLNKWKEERWILQSEKEVKMIENVMKEAEKFLEE